MDIRKTNHYVFSGIILTRTPTAVCPSFTPDVAETETGLTTKLNACTLAAQAGVPAVEIRIRLNMQRPSPEDHQTVSFLFNLDPVLKGYSKYYITQIQFDLVFRGLFIYIE